MSDAGLVWAVGAFGSVIGSTATAYLIGDEATRTKINFVIPFILVASIGIVKVLSEQR